MTATRVCSIDEIPENRTRVIAIGEKEIQLTRMNGEVYAFDNVCTHDDAPIGERDISVGEIQCPRHGAKFDVKSGRATGLPAIMPIKTYQVTIEDGDVFIDL
jgi:3-phenylpropionate/trans-cinnamate dioxygenase ferredoxin subunit